MAVPTPHLEQLTPFEVDLRSIANIVTGLGAAGLFVGVVTFNPAVIAGSFAVSFAGQHTSSSIDRASSSRAQA